MSKFINNGCKVSWQLYKDKRGIFANDPTRKGDGPPLIKTMKCNICGKFLNDDKYFNNNVSCYHCN